MQLDAPTTTNTAKTQATCIDNTTTTTIERSDEGCISSNSNDNELIPEDDSMRGANEYITHNSDPTTICTQPDTSSNSANNKGSPGTALYIAKITGYISKTINTDTTTNTTTHTNNNTMNIQYIYVNNRPVDLPKINRLLTEIWLKYALKSHTNISYILNIHLPTYTYDINMSPNKREIVLLYENDILNWMRITINRLYSETTHGVFLMSNNNLNNYDMLGNKGSSSDNMVDFKNSNKDNVHNATPNISSHPTTTTTCTDVAYTNTSATTFTSTALQPTSSTSQPTAECLMVENNNNNINLSSQITIQNTDCDLDNDKSVNAINFDLNSSYIPRLNQSAARRGGDVITADLTHLTHIDLIHDIDKEEYNNNYEYNNGEDEDVYTSNSNMSRDKGNISNTLYTELPSSSSSSSVVWMEESEVVIMTPPTTHTQPVDRQIESESITDSTAAILTSADASGTYTNNTSSSSIDNNIVGEKRKHSYNNTDELSNTTAHKSIKLDDNSSTSSSSSSATATREIWSRYQPIDENNNTNSNSNSNTTTYSNDSNSYTNNILQSCTNNATSLLHYINTHTTHTNNTHVNSNTSGSTCPHFSTLDFWFPDTDFATNTDSLYNNNEAYIANNTAHIATGSTDAVVADIMALFSATSPATTNTTTATTAASSKVDMTQIPRDEQGPAMSEEGVTAATSESVTAATSVVAEEPLYTLKTISKEVCKY